MNSETYHYKRGANQQFCQTSHIFDPTQYNEDDLTYSMEREVIPIAIHCVVEDGIEGWFLKICNYFLLHWCPQLYAMK